MYDPEAAFEEEKRINTIRQLIAEVQEDFGDKCPNLVELYRLIGEGFERLHQLSQDLDSCFDSDERERIKKEAKEIIAILKPCID